MSTLIVKYIKKHTIRRKEQKGQAAGRKEKRIKFMKCEQMNNPDKETH